MRFPNFRIAHAGGWCLLASVLATASSAADSTAQKDPPEKTDAARVYRDHVDAHWFADNHYFWYRNDSADGKRDFVLVDVEAGTRVSAFDHQRLAVALSKALKRTYDADHLPVQQLNFNADLSAVDLTIALQAWRLDLKSFELTKLDAAPPAGRALSPLDHPHPSNRTGRATRLTFLNRTAATFDVYWLDSAGEKKHYAQIKAGDSWESSTFDGHVWLVTDHGGKTLGAFEAERNSAIAVIGEAVAQPRRKSRPRQQPPTSTGSPDGNRLIAVKESNLWVRKTDQSEISLSHDGTASDHYASDQLWWSPDSKRLAALRTVPAEEHKIFEVESSPKDQLQPKLRTLDYLKPGDRIARPRPQLFDMQKLQSIPVDDRLFANPWSIEEIRWSADSSRFTFVYNERGHQVMRVVAVDAISGEATSIIDERNPTFVCYSSKYFCHWIEDREIIWMSERDGWNHLWLYDAQTGSVKNQITAGPWVVQKVERVDEEARQVWFMAGGILPEQDPYYAHLCRVNLDGTGLVVLTPDDGQHRVQWSPDRKYLIDTWSRVDLPPITELRRADNGHLVCRLEDANASEVLSARGGRWPRRFVAKGRDGETDIYGAILLPREFDPGKKYPVLENIYAGPHGFFTPKEFRPRFGTQQHLADQGMIVVQCDGMGTSGRSKAFHDVCWKNLRDAGFPDRIAWIKAAAQEIPQMDLTRVGIYGGSAGGQSAMGALLWHHDFYKVAVADCGCHDNRMDKIWWNEQWMGWPVGSEYAENSNAVNAHLLEGKLLLIVGELDSNVDPASTMQVVNALEKSNKVFDLVIVTGSNHGAAETPYGSLRRQQFLVKNLVDGQSARAKKSKVETN